MSNVVLAYHAVAECPREDDVHNLFVSPAAFAAQMETLARTRQVVSLERLLTDPPTSGPPAVALTFDDAYTSVRAHALPVLARHGFPSTVFVPTAYLGDRNRWDAPSRCPLEVMDAADLRACADAAMDAQSHGHAHIDMTRATAEEVADDLAASQAILARAVGHAPRYLAWPFSTGAPHARKVAADLGFAAAFSIDRPAEGPFARERVQITPLDGPGLFALKTSGRYLRLRHHAVVRVGYATARRILSKR